MKWGLVMILIGLQADCCEENAGVASTQTAVKLQSLAPDEGPESSAQDDSMYASTYQALDPKCLDWTGFILFLSWLRLLESIKGKILECISAWVHIVPLHFLYL